ncbi:hypothetical protein A2627_02995 [Candidatus Woesebacteria bacterium RIFCSPHIGHO2_01_FULL_39_28]|uniref:UDP-N-acetylmuramyl-tripeptide synthetase n=1 Tax=Candidatus Woesebacteria bacterium RIFCSPHIGHO2_01_FULL_39_28 TaxID=1802496 RepID=A0A1F7YCK1_9BACT|nr:MAG: hypothetical protein A2627_02995 [Candidatus Woesebacteria bacterium RIFCSPHIGHO2_01_FULL_39_28]OGM58014.1 MAG: hypothetical protein A3A50_02005 [Candidatus Woesebacteria bacterium RIFCSPLOWO2_01_FULL_38_20]
MIRKLIPQKIKNIWHYLNSLTSVIYFGYPARKLKVIAVTGTDGKTTTCTLIYHILKTAGFKVALISSVAAYIGDKEIDTGFHVTTPDPWRLQKTIYLIVNSNINYLVLEATSHGIDQHRLLGTNISMGILTNITHEHLDYHKTFGNYLRAKAKLFKNLKIAILNHDDDSFERIKKLIPKKVKILSYSMNSPHDKIRESVKARFKEKYNLSNAAGAVKVAKLLGVSDSIIIAAIKNFPGVSGRMEEIKNKKEIKIFVDFAHTPNALKQVLSASIIKRGGKLICVFGCAGERDKEKRPMMGEISAKLADISIFTAEDPRSENVNKIISEIAEGARSQGAKEREDFFKISERGESISFAIQKLAKKGDTVIVCGKGHEKSMAYKGVEYPWSDYDAVKIALKGGIKEIKK